MPSKGRGNAIENSCHQRGGEMLLTLQKFLFFAQHSSQSDSFNNGNITFVAENFFKFQVSRVIIINYKNYIPVFLPFEFVLNNYTYFSLNRNMCSYLKQTQKVKIQGCSSCNL